MTGSQDTNSTLTSLRDNLRVVLQGLPANYNERFAGLLEVRHLVHNAIAESLQGPFNEHLKALPHATLSEKQEIASFANDQLSQLGLAIRCEKNNRPAILCADFKSSVQPHITRFRLEVKNDLGHKMRAGTWRTTPDFILMEDDRRKESFAKRFLKRDDNPGKSL